MRLKIFIRWLIPACAGKTCSLTAMVFSLRAHPRVCGENRGLFVRVWPRRGSSPRVRGKLDTIRELYAAPGLIPACAGKTSLYNRNVGRLPAHPRVCGENSRSPHREDTGPGSSPRVRGKPYRQAGTRGSGRLIPACAGKTEGEYEFHCQSRAHPRVCGENLKHCQGLQRVPGSSPRVRGKLGPLAASRLAIRLIPACAGKTLIVMVRSVRVRAHPRVCGENGLVPFQGGGQLGSSPRVRGKPTVHPKCHAPCRLIPACAGKTTLNKTG